MKAYIKHISTYIPKNKITNEDIAKKFPEWDSDKILNKIGIAERYIADEDEFVSDMAAKSIQELIDEFGINKDSIDFLILCTQSPDHFLPATSCIVQEKAGLNNNCAAIDINQGCSGYVYGLSLAKGLVISGTAKNVVLVTAETYSKHIHQNDKGNISLFGDAATATLITDNGKYEIKEFSLGSDGKGAENLIVKNGAVKIKNNNDPENLDNFLYMNGPEIFDFTSKSIPPLVERNLEQNQLTKGDIDTFIFHQANTYMLNFLRRKIGIPTKNFVIDMLDYGNTVSSTIPLALKNCDLKGREMHTVMLVGFGVGYSWGAVCLKKHI